MKKLLLLFFIISTVTINSQIIFEDDFESYTDFTISNFGNWVMYDIDNTPTWGTAEASYPNQGYTGSAIILNVNEIQDGQIPFDPNAGNYSIRDTGEKYASFWCAVEASNNNYLISPLIDLNNTTLPTVSFWAKSLASAVNGFDPEIFEVLLSTTGNNIEDFTINLGAINEIYDCCIWNNYEYDLSNYIDNEVYIAIHHISTENTYALHIDDFKVFQNTSASVDDINNLNISYYPNPVKDNLTVKADKVINSITISNSLGQIILKQNANDNNINIDTSILSKGVYYISIISSNNKTNLSFIKN